MTRYQLSWITDSLAVGYAPMSYAELDSIKEQGVTAIVNLCGEFSDLHEIEEQSGFEVFFLPVPDESAPEMEEMEKALAWLDEAIYLGKKVLIHCRHGIGRTGTFVSAYLLRKGIGLKVAETILKKSTRATPTNYVQWRLLKKYGKKSGGLTIRKPSLEGRHVVDLSEFFSEYEALVMDVEEKFEQSVMEADQRCGCGTDNNDCCCHYFELKMIEAIYLNNKINKTLSSSVRKETISRAVEVSQYLRPIARQSSICGDGNEMDRIFARESLICPLNVFGKCIMYSYRPIRCRNWGVPEKILENQLIEDVLSNISRNVFFALVGTFPEKNELCFSCPDTVSGRFIQSYFHYLAGA